MKGYAERERVENFAYKSRLMSLMMYPLTRSCKDQNTSSVTTLYAILRTFFSVKVVASRRRVISLRRGCRHVPGLLVASEGMISFGGGGDSVGVDLMGVDLVGVDLAGVDLAGVDFAGSNFAGTGFAGADLFGADLFGVDIVSRFTSCLCPLL